MSDRTASGAYSLSPNALSSLTALQSRPPLLDAHMRLFERLEDLATQRFVPELADEALAVAVLPRAAELDIEGPGADLSKPGARDPDGHLREDDAGDAAIAEKVERSALS